MHDKIRNLHYLKSFGYEFISKENVLLSAENLGENQNVQNLHTQNLDANLKGQKFNETSKNVRQKFIKLRAEVCKCELCALSKKRKNALMENAFKPCKIMVVSSFADKSEDESGVVLDSTRGVWLKSAINSALNESEFYTSYIYKCFNAHKNDANALFQCLPYFWAEFELINPRFLLILGEESFENLGFADFKRLRGEVFSHLNAFVMATFSVEFIEKNPSFKAEFMSDLSKIKAFL